MKLEKIKIYVALAIAAITIIGAVITVDKYFAKSGDVEITVKDLEVKDELVQERLDIAITDDQIFQQEQHIQQMTNYHIFEQKPDIPEMTPMEKEALKKAGERLEMLKGVKAEKIKKYEKLK